MVKIIILRWSNSLDQRNRPRTDTFENQVLLQRPKASLNQNIVHEYPHKLQ